MKGIIFVITLSVATLLRIGFPDSPRFSAGPVHSVDAVSPTLSGVIQKPLESHLPLQFAPHVLIMGFAEERPDIFL